jgi:hypothetical protein
VVILGTYYTIVIYSMKFLIVHMMHPNSSIDPKVGPKAKQQKKKKVGAHSLTCNTLGVGGRVGAPGWD